jgi:hypothetical protein
LSFGILISPLVSLAADAGAAPTPAPASLIAQAEVRRDDARPVLKDAAENRVQNNRSTDNRNSNASSNVPRPVKNTGLTSCPGEFALCAASTCKPTGRMIKVKEADGKTTKEFPEAICTCPIITEAVAVMNGKELAGLAALNEGNMQGSCNTPRPGTIWSLFSPLEVYPQESTTPPFQLMHTNVQTCQAGGRVQGSNCFSFLCEIDKQPAANGVRTASCSCPIGENPFGAPTQNSEFLTSAGGYYNPPSQACSMYPVSIPNIADLK